jgi:hypothetical protein
MLYKGLFKAPQNGRYRFHMTCDDSCAFLLNTEIGAESLPDHLNELIRRTSYGNFRDWNRLITDDDDSLYGVMFSPW